MKKKDDIDDFDFSDEEAFNKRFRRIEGEELEQLKVRLGRARLGGIKRKQTTYLRLDIEDIKNDLLNDKDFLCKLKSALAM